MKEFGVDTQGPSRIQRIAADYGSATLGLPAITTDDLGRMIALVGLRKDINYFKTPEWDESVLASNEKYCVRHWFRNKPEKIWINNVEQTEGTVGALSSGQWGWGDVDGLGHNTIYIYYTSSISVLRGQPSNFVQKSEEPQLFIGGAKEWRNMIAPVGSLLFSTTRFVEDGYIEIDGGMQLAATYPFLETYLKEGSSNPIYGYGTGNFKVPDFRGLVPRFWDHSRGVDPDAGSRNEAWSVPTGDRVGSAQQDALQQHVHRRNSTTYNEVCVTQDVSGGGAFGGGSHYLFYATDTGGVPSPYRESDETRMSNVYVMCAIKYI